jgi:hypothetical protein
VSFKLYLVGFSTKWEFLECLGSYSYEHNGDILVQLRVDDKYRHHISSVELARML